MKIAKTVFLIVFLVFAGCANEEIDHRLRAILGYADMGIVEVPIDEPIEVYFVATVNGSDRRADGTRMISNVPFRLQSDTLIGIQRMSEKRLGVFVSDGSSSGLNWILNEIGPLEGTKMVGPNHLPYSGGPRILFMQFPIDERERPMIQVFMVSDPSKVPYYDVEENIYSEKTESISSSLL